MSSHFLDASLLELSAHVPARYAASQAITTCTTVRRPRRTGCWWRWAGLLWLRPTVTSAPTSTETIIVLGARVLVFDEAGAAAGGPGDGASGGAVIVTSRPGLPYPSLLPTEDDALFIEGKGGPTQRPLDVVGHPGRRRRRPGVATLAAMYSAFSD